ncbi:MAG: hypothetical protein ABI147_00360 [Acidobacteriaceae bacterium]
MREHHGEALRLSLDSADDLEFALYTGSSPTESSRYPKKGWIPGNVRDLSVLIQAASVPPQVIEDAANHLVEGVSEAAAILQELNLSNPGAIKKIAEELKQDSGEQTLRMAATMLTNALVFQESLANGPGELSAVKSLEEIRTANGEFSRSDVLAEWKKILEVNYWPIFDISLRILKVIPPATSSFLLSRLAKTAEELLANRLMRSHDLTGAVFQRVIADRKFLAAYYTTPASASLLIGLAITNRQPISGKDWSDATKVKSLRIADFSCGTGTLLSTAYQRIGQLHELAGGDSEAIHPDMMARALVGCDVLPAAAHLTASMLAGSHPTVKYTQSSILTVAYGVLPGDKVATGSLELLNPQKKMEEWAITAKAAGGKGESEENPWVTLPHQDFDLVVMNPPFVRATGQEAEKKGLANPMFAAFSASDKDQRRMGGALEVLARGSSAHGNAGLASYFFVLADRKLRVGGVLALVMPLSFLSGEAWEESRKVLARSYSEIVVVSIAGAKDEEMAFSADTGMGECLVVARKTRTGKRVVNEPLVRASDRATFIVLQSRPSSQLLGYSVGQQIGRLQAGGKMRRLEDGPIGGTRIVFGDEIVGQSLDAPIPNSGAWSPTRVSDLSLTQSAFQICKKGLLWLPSLAESEAKKIPMTTVEVIGQVGPYHADISGLNANGTVRGPFEHLLVEDSGSVTYPILWGHNADRERSMCFEADSEGLIRDGATLEKAEGVWATRSHCHFNQNFRFNSQSTGMQYTSRKSIGGRAWIGIKCNDARLERALVAWSNTSVGILIHWNHANKQQAGRGNVVPTSLRHLPILNVTALSEEKLDIAAAIFEEFSSKQLLSIDQIHIDLIRQMLDEEFFKRVLDLPNGVFAEDGAFSLLRKKLSQEPSITGRRKGQSKTVKKARQESPVKSPSLQRRASFTTKTAKEVGIITLKLF